MGNVTSNSESDEEGASDQGELVDHAEDEPYTNDNETCCNMADLDQLFTTTKLRNLASKIKETLPMNPLNKHRAAIVRWLDDKENRTEEIITVKQFCEFLSSKDVPWEDAMKAYNVFDTDGTGVTEIIDMQEILKSGDKSNTMGALGRSVRALQACALSPGFADVYSREKYVVPHHGNKILEFLWKNHVPSRDIPFVPLNGYNNISYMRVAVLNNLFEHFSSTLYKEDSEAGSSGEEMRTVTKCYNRIEVSSNTGDIKNLEDGNTGTYWQSDGSARSHWVKFRMKNNIIVKNISVYVMSLDQSYMPELISVSVGSGGSAKMKELKEVRVASHLTGDVVIAKNLKAFYPVIQINIKRCQSDGCDTRIRNFKITGYKVVKESGFGVVDASAVWYMQMLTSSVRATALLAPSLKNMALEHTKNALNHIPPLALGPSASKPKFISKHLLKEIGFFLEDMFTTSDEFLEEGLSIALAFNLAQGHIGNIVKTLKSIQDHENIKLNCYKLLKKMNETRAVCWEKYCTILKINDSVTDGRQKLEASLRDIIVNHAFSTPSSTFFSEELKTPILNAFFFTSDIVQLTKIRIKVVNGDKAPKQALVFVYRKEENFDMETDKKKFEDFDNFFSDAWEYAEQTDISKGSSGKSIYPVAHVKFKTEDEETEVTFSTPVTGNAVLIKFWGIRGNEKSMGLSGIKFFGFPRRCKFAVQNSVTSSPSDSCVSEGTYPCERETSEQASAGTNSETNDTKTDCKEMMNNSGTSKIILEVLSFLVDLAEIQAALKGKSSTTELLDFSEVPIETMWQLCKHFSETKNVKCEILILNLIHNLIPYLSSKAEAAPEVIQTIFKYVCSTIDNPPNIKEDELQIYKQLVIDGAPVFFPDKESRKKQLFNMMKSVDNLTAVPSVTVVFQSLCHFYSNVDPSGLLELPDKSQKCFDGQQALSIMDNVLIVAVHEVSSFISTPSNKKDKVHLIHLVNSLQTTLLSWCEDQLRSNDSKLTSAANNIICTYAVSVLQQAVKCVRKMLELDGENLTSAVDYLQHSFIGSTVSQFILHMTLVSEHVKPATKLCILKEVFSLIKELQNISPSCAEMFPSVISSYWDNLKTTDTDLRVWEVESPHNYENNSHVTDTFSCPGAARFIVDFDPRCETERRYDFLEFTDSNGLKVKYDQSVGTTKWPLQVIFGGPFLNFLFQSDNSNSEWGYKFKVTARGSPDVTLPWLFDLQLGTVKLFGQLCGSALSVSTDNKSDGDAGNDDDLLQSDLWSTLFRGGYLIGKLQRSLSGKFMAESSAAVLNFLTSMISGTGNLQKEFISKCKEQHKGQRIGGQAVDEAILTVFASLIWHTQQLQENLEKYIISNGKDALCDGIYQAYNCAESIRLHLMQQRQQYNIDIEDEKAENLVDPIQFTKDKAHYLLKFPGLKKTQLKSDLRPKSIKRKKSERNIRCDPNYTDKFQSFRLVVEFIQDSAWTIDRVHKVLHDRQELSVAVIEVYQSMIQFLKVMNDKHIFQIPVVLFFQELLHNQEKFPHHYSKGLEGCGLLQEAKVRSAFYEIIRQLSTVFHKTQRKEWTENPSLQNVLAAYDYIQASFLHLITVQWKPFDLFFIADIKLPELLLKVAKETVKIRNYFPSNQEEEDELKDYNKYMNWFDECSDGFLNWYNKKESLEKEEKRQVQMFIARYCDLLDVEITCDGCGVTLPGRRYRCLQCVDMDLCATCFASGVKPAGEHTDEHDIVHLVFKCNQCQAFIVGERIHCDECDDFDLCLGCHKKGSTPSGHKEQHSITKIPMMKLRNNKDSNSHMQAYIHQHVWLLFASLSLNMVEFLQEGTGQNLVNHIEYLKWGNDLHDMCVCKAKHYLKLVPSDADEQIKHFSEENNKDLDKHQEMAFAIHSQERIVSLIGALIKQGNRQKSATENFLNQDFLSLLFVIIHTNTGHEFSTQHLSLGILQQLLRICPPHLADEAVKSVSEVKQCHTCEGYLTVQYLIDYGSAFLNKSDLGWSCSISRVLHTLLSSTEWSQVATKCLHSCISDSEKENANKSIYGLFVIAGFPDVPTIGSCVEYNKHGFDTKEGVVLKHYPDKSQSLVIDVCTRKRYSVADQYTHLIGTPCSILETETVQIFAETVQSAVNKLKSGSTESIGNLMVLALSLKGLNTMLKNASTHFPDICKSSFVQSLVYLASKGTGLSQQWMLRDLEILSLMMYTHNDKEILKKPALDSTKSEGSVSSSKHEDSDSDDDSDDSSSTFSLPSYDTDFNDTEEEDLNNIFKGVDVTMKLMLEDFHKEIKVPLSVLKAIFEMNDKNTSSFLKAIAENFEGHARTTGEDIKKLVQKWDKVLESGSVENVMTAVLSSDQVIDTGVVLQPALFKIDKINKAIAEPTTTQQKLIKTNEDEAQDEIDKQRRIKSAELLKKAVGKQGRKNTEEFAMKVNQAISILYGRQVLTSVLAQWVGTDVEITAELLGCKEIQQIPCILDLLNRYDDKGSFHKVVEKVIQYVEVSSLPAVAKSACQFLEETTLSALTRQSAHSYEVKDVEEELKLQGASFLTISFESICATKEDKDELIFSTSADFQEERHVFSGTSKSNWSSFQVPGDTLFFKFACTSSSSDGLYGYSFTVTAGSRDSFDTGYTILGKIFKEPQYMKHIPLSSIWSSLVYVACKETGTARLKTLRLILLVLDTQHKPCKSDTLDIDLRLLKPLWILYCNITSEDDADLKACISPVVRALTEVFIEVEALAVEWDMTLDYLVAVQETECLRKSIGMGILNVAYLSHAIDYKNCVVDFVSAIQEKRASSSLLKPLS